MIIPEDLRVRTEAAILRITRGQAPMRVPVDQTDPDVVLAEWLRAGAPMPPAGAEPEIFGYWCAPHFAPELGIFHRDISGSIRDHCDVTELLDRLYVTRLQAEVSALQQRLTVADQRVDDLESGLIKARELLAERSVIWNSIHGIYQFAPAAKQCSALSLNNIVCSEPKGHDGPCGCAPAAKGGE